MSADLPNYSFNNTSGTSALEIQRLDYFTTYCNPDQVETHHRVDFNMIIFITKGHGQHNIDFKTYPYKRGTFLFMSRGQAHAFTLNPEADGFLIYFTETFYRQYQIQFNELLYSYPFNTGLFKPVLPLSSEVDTFAALFDAIQQDYSTHPNLQAEEIHQCYLRILLLKIRAVHQKTQQESVPVDPGSIRLFIEFQRKVEESLTTNRNANFYCHALNVSFKKLNDLCKKLTRKTVKQYLDERLILEAKRCLTHQQLNISEIAYSLGFDEVTNFTKYFKRHVCQSPLAFRQSLRKGLTILGKD